jgi:hypothetical protein
MPIRGLGGQFTLDQLKEAVTDVVSPALSKQTEDLL